MEKSIFKIMIAEVETDVDLEIYETYYINKLKPLYNKDKLYKNDSNLKLNDLMFKEYKDVNKLNILELTDGTVGKYTKLKIVLKGKCFKIETMCNILKINKKSAYKELAKLIEYGVIFKEGNNYSFLEM